MSAVSVLIIAILIPVAFGFFVWRLTRRGHEVRDSDEASSAIADFRTALHAAFMDERRRASGK